MTQHPGTLSTLGYAHPDAETRLHHLMSEPQTLLIDIRLSPWSRWRPAWNTNALASRFGNRYIWAKRLGNVNYKDRERGIQLAEGHEEAIQKAVNLLQRGYSLVLLCACKHEETCHRRVVAALIQNALHGGEKNCG